MVLPIAVILSRWFISKVFTVKMLFGLIFVMSGAFITFFTVELENSEIQSNLSLTLGIALLTISFMCQAF